MGYYNISSFDSLMENICWYSDKYDYGITFELDKEAQVIQMKSRGDIIYNLDIMDSIEDRRALASFLWGIMITHPKEIVEKNRELFKDQVLNKHWRES